MIATRRDVRAAAAAITLHADELRRVRLAVAGLTGVVGALLVVCLFVGGTSTHD